MKRDTVEGYEAARKVFEAAGFTCTLESGGKHPMCVAAKRGCVIRHPIPGTPRRGQGSSAWLAAMTARKRLKRLGEGEPA